MKILLLISFLLSPYAFAQGRAASLSSEDFSAIIQAGLQNIYNLQKTADKGEEYWAGEWGSEMSNVRRVVALGPKGKKASDANCFTTTHIHNELAKYVLRNDELTDSSARALNLALDNILTFKSAGGTFNFWHKLPMTNVIRQKAPAAFKNELVSRPNQYELKNTFAAVRSNIADDADDTAVAYSALYYNQILAEKFSSRIKISPWQPSEVTSAFEAHRDVDRTRNIFNFMQGARKNSGAYLTWLTAQNSTFLGSVFKGWDDNLRIPEGSNNVDCVVNSNVLQMLAQYGHGQSEGARAACRFVENAIDHGAVKKCGIYYPNPYQLHFAVSEALEAGADCLKPAAEKLFALLRSEQNDNGSWGYVREPKRLKLKELTSPISSTVYAANAFYIFADQLKKDDAATNDHAERAAQFIGRAATKKSDGTLMWTPGVFFSGGTFVRRLVIWKSEAYTSMLAVQALDRFNHLRK